MNIRTSSQNKIDIVDVQNASLSGGVAVGAIADLMIQPYGAFFMGSLCGIVSTLGYRLLQVSDNATIILIPFLDIYLLFWFSYHSFFH